MRLASPARPRAHPPLQAAAFPCSSLWRRHTPEPAGSSLPPSAASCCRLPSQLLLALSRLCSPFSRSEKGPMVGGVAGGGLCLLCRVDLEVGKVGRWVGSLLILIQSLLKSIGAFPRVRLLARRLESLSQSLKLQPYLLHFPAGLRSLPSTPLPVLVGCAPFTKPALG